MFKDKLPFSKLPPAKLPTAAQLAASSQSSSTAPPPTAPTLALHAISYPAAAPPSTHAAVTNAAGFSEMCDAAALVRARCRTPLPGRQAGACYCGQQDNDGLPHGHGLLCLADGSFFFGSFVHGHRQELALRSVSNCDNM